MVDNQTDSVTDAKIQQPEWIDNVIQFQLLVFGAVGLFGSITNSINMVVFTKLGFKDTINISLTGLAVSDFCVCLLMFAQPCLTSFSIKRIFLESFNVDIWKIAHVLCIQSMLNFNKVTVLLTAFVTIERCICVVTPLKVRSILTPTRVKCIVILCFIAAGVTLGHARYLQYPRWMFISPLNGTYLTLYTIPSFQKVIKWRGPLDKTFFFFLPFILIIFATMFLAKSLTKSLEWKEKMSNFSSSSSSSDTKERRVVRLVFTIAAAFCLLSFPTAIISLLWSLVDSFSSGGKDRAIFDLFGYAATTAMGVNSSINLFIYYKNSSAYKQVFDQIFNSCVKTK